MQTADIARLAEQVKQGDRVALGRAISLIESSRAEHRVLAAELQSRCHRPDMDSRRIGITGVPGVGKSTFIEAIGTRLADSGSRVAVLAVDPSSEMGKGSILGDRTRMERLSSHPNAFIRPTASGGSLGGVARRTRETIMLCEAAGYDTIIIETVGVGQSETAVHDLVDMFVLLVLATAGDELQGIKRGIMEMADMVVINKDDGTNASHTALAKAGYHHALHLFPAKDSGWTVPVLSCSSIDGTGLDGVLQTIDTFFHHIRLNGHLLAHRKAQDLRWMEKAVAEELMADLMQRPEVRSHLQRLKEEILSGRMSPFEAARMLIASKS